MREKTNLLNVYLYLFVSPNIGYTKFYKPGLTFAQFSVGRPLHVVTFRLDSVTICTHSVTFNRDRVCAHYYHQLLPIHIATIPSRE
jgi:hypothetical protein